MLISRSSSNYLTPASWHTSHLQTLTQTIQIIIQTRAVDDFSGNFTRSSKTPTSTPQKKRKSQRLPHGIIFMQPLRNFANKPLYSKINSAAVETARSRPSLSGIVQGRNTFLSQVLFREAIMSLRGRKLPSSHLLIESSNFQRLKS